MPPLLCLITYIISTRLTKLLDGYTNSKKKATNARKDLMQQKDAIFTNQHHRNHSTNFETTRSFNDLSINDPIGDMMQKFKSNV